MTAEKNKVARAILVVFALLVFIGAGAAFRHMVSSGVSKYITRDHEVRRILSKAERDGIRTAAIAGERGDMRPPPRQIVGSSPAVEVLISDYSPSAAQLWRPGQRSPVLERSPVLNL